MEDLHHNDQQDDGEDHDERLVTVVAVIDRDLAEAAASDDAAHGRVAENRRKRDGRVGEQ